MTDYREKKYKVGIVLSGGGTRGFAHLGVLQALNDNKIYPEIISSVSAGSIAGVLYADGHEPKDILKTITEKNIFHYIKLFFPRRGLIKMSGLVNMLNKTLKAKNIEDLKIPVLIHSVNLNKGKYVCFEKGNIIDSVKASASIPVVFPPVKIDGEYYLDGGLINNFPLEPLEGVCEKIIGVNLNPIGETDDLNSIRKIAERAFHITLKSHTIDSKNKCDIYIEPGSLESFSLLNLKKAKKAFDLGYTETVKALDRKGWI